MGGIRIKKVYIIFTGGTIASKFNDKTGKAEASVCGDDLLKTVHGTEKIADVEIEQFSNVSGHTLTLDSIFELAKRIRTAVARDDITGVVVTHGTAGLEEACYMAELTVQTNKPVVFTGAMYNASYSDSDGPRNLINAIRVAVDPVAMDMGVLVCLNSQIHSAKDAVKIHTTQLHTFSSYEHGILGQVDPDRVIFYRRPLWRRFFNVNNVETNVDLIKASLGMDARFFKASVSAGAQGIIIESLPGTGSVSLGMMSGIEEAIEKGIPVVITSRCPEGRVIPIYGGGSGSKDVAELGCILAGDLPATKARVLLSVALRVSSDPNYLREIFSTISP